MGDSVQPNGSKLNKGLVMKKWSLHMAMYVWIRKSIVVGK